MCNKKILSSLCLLFLALTSCDKKQDVQLNYYQVRVKNATADWRDSSFIIATANPQLMAEAEAQLKKPVSERKMVSGALLRGNGGYNKNAGHAFKWRFREDNWSFTEASIEIYDGRPYSDVDSDTAYWFGNMKHFAPWNSYVAKKITIGQP